MGIPVSTAEMRLGHHTAQNIPDTGIASGPRVDSYAVDPHPARPIRRNGDPGDKLHVAKSEIWPHTPSKTRLRYGLVTAGDPWLERCQDAARRPCPNLVEV